MLFININAETYISVLRAATVFRDGGLHHLPGRPRVGPRQLEQQRLRGRAQCNPDEDPSHLQHLGQLESGKSGTEDTGSYKRPGNCCKVKSSPWYFTTGASSKLPHCGCNWWSLVPFRAFGIIWNVLLSTVHIYMKDFGAYYIGHRVPNRELIA